MNCPECGAELWHKDTFGNIDYCMEAIRHPIDPYGRPRRPVKAGDIYWCSQCESHYHTFDGDLDIHHGYPC